MYRNSAKTFGSIIAAVILLIPADTAQLNGQAENPNTVVDPALFGAMHFRSVGPHRGGRVTAVAGYADRPYRFLVGTVGGGIWRTTDAGQNWDNISDGYIRVGAVGALAIAPSNQEVIYAGTGSGGPRGNISVGDGIYKSTDGGEAWCASANWIG